MKLSIFGTGYVGLVTAACFAELGNEVCGFDIDESKIAKLRAGEAPFYEPGLNDLVGKHAEGRLTFTADPKEAVDHGEIIFIAVGTPSQENGEPDLQYVYAAAQMIANHIGAGDKVIVMKSTVPVGTSREIEDILRKEL